MYSLKVVCVFVIVFVVSESMGTKMTPEAKRQFCANNPGSNFHDGCNGCACSSDKSGEAVCTLLPCPDHFDHATPPSQEVPAQPNCVGYAGVKWTDGCNSCTCSTDAKVSEPACTRKGCPPSQRSPWKPVQM